MTRVVLAVLAILLGVQTARADALRLDVVAGPFPPFRFINEHGRPSGLDVDIIEAAARLAGGEARIRIVPFLRAMELVKRGEADAIATLTRNPEREAFLLFSEPVSAVRDVFFKRRDKRIEWEALDDLLSYRVGAAKGYNYAGGFRDIGFPYLREVIAGAEEGPEERLMRLLVADRIDVAICEISVCGYLLSTRRGYGDVIEHIDRSVGPVRPFHLAFSKARAGGARKLRAFDEALRAYKAQGLHRKVYERYNASIDID